MQKKIKTFKILILAYLLITFTIIYFLIYLPVQKQLKEIFIENFWHSAQGHSQIIEHNFEDHKRDIINLSNDYTTVALIEDYVLETSTFESLKNQLQIEYSSNASRISNLIRATRYIDNKIVCVYKDEIHEEFSQNNVIFSENNNTYFKVYSPIYYENEQLGYDIAVFNITDSLRTSSFASQIVEPDSVKKIVNNKILHSIDDKALYSTKDSIIYIEPIKDTEYYIYITIDKDTIFKPLGNVSRYFFIGTTASITLIAFLTNWFVVKRARRLLAISERREERYRKDSMIDPLSGAYSRRYLDDWIKKESRYEKKDNFHYSMVLLDVDRFKQINDSCGHLSGDKAIQIVSHVLYACIRSTDVVIRYGGDEFMLLLKNCDAKQAEDIMDRVCEFLKNRDDVPFEISISYGIQEIHSRQDILEAMNMADRKMYEAKKAKEAY